MSGLEIALALANGLGLPLILWALRAGAELKSTVTSQAVSIARLEERSDAMLGLISEIRSLRDEIGKAVTKLASLEAKLEAAIRSDN
jgi:hypothetical protein